MDKRRLSCVGLLLLNILAGCATQGGGIDENRVGETLTTPLSDFNLMHPDIPPVLVDAAKDPYRFPADSDCASLSAQVRELDRVLGADVDHVINAHKSLFEQGRESLGDAALGAVARTVEGVVPFRSWIRRLSGAEQQARDRATAIAAGVVRRSYLKGIGKVLDCLPPASPLPLPLPPEETKGETK